MVILIKGAGITGCTIARLLRDKDYDITIYEKESEIGGLCKTKDTEGILHDKYGCHLLRYNSETVHNLVHPYFNLNNKHHYVGTYINGRIFDWPISLDNVSYLISIFGDAVMPRKDLHDNPATFRDVSLNTFGSILYKLFVENYTRNMWHRDPKELDAEVAAKVLKINDNDKRYFKTKYQGWPKGGYSYSLGQMIKDIPIHFNVRKKPNHFDQDFMVYTGPIDEYFNHKYGRLEYVGMHFEHEVVDKLDPVELYRYPVINYPNCEFGYIRQTAYRGITGQLAQKEVVGYEYPDKDAKTHPVRSKENKLKLFRYLKDASKAYGFIPAGRLGLFRYMSMDDAIEMAMKIAHFVPMWNDIIPSTRLDLLCKWANLNPKEYDGI